MKRIIFLGAAMVAIAWLTGCGIDNPIAPIQSTSVQELTQVQARSATSVIPCPSTVGESKVLGRAPSSPGDGIAHVMRDTALTWRDLKRIYLPTPADGGGKPRDK
jgi:hypothetical protein